MSEAERVYSSAQVGKLLDLSGGMVRRYAITLERLTGEPIHQDARDGRQFSQRHVETLTAARRFVEARRGTSVEEGLRRALGLAQEAADVPPLASGPGMPPETAAAFSEALRRYGEPLLTELRTLRESNTRLADEVEALRHEVGELRALPAEDRVVVGGMSERTDERQDGGALVRLARRLEAVLRKGL